MNADILGLSGGRKQQWLRLHRQEVLSFYELRGVESTLVEFNLRPDTLRRLLVGKPEKDAGRLSPSERALYMAEQALEADRVTRSRVNELERRIAAVQPILEFGVGLAKAMRQLEQRLLLVDFQRSEKTERE